MMMTKAATNDGRYGIGAVAKLTGLTDHTIRVWERRYAAVVATRAPNGRREYTAQDVEKLRLLKLLTSNGFSISQIARDDVAELRRRARDVADAAASPMPREIRTAVLGDFLPGQLTTYERDLAPLNVVVADNKIDHFLADLHHQSVDVVVLEQAILDRSVVDRLLEYVEQAGAGQGVLVYTFGRASDLDLAIDSRIVALRGPVNIEELRAAVIRAFMQSEPERPRARSQARSEHEGWDDAGPIAPRRFDQQQLSNLARQSTAIDCECPHHLARLVGDLSAFEIYSANCANRNEEDAALHRYLHQTTAKARAMVEEALEHVAKAEGLSY